MSNKPTGARKWMTLILVAIAGGIITKLPYLRETYMAPLMEATGANATQLGLIMSAYGIVNFICYFPGGVLADKFSCKKLIVVSCIGTALAGFWYWTLPGFIWLVVIHAIFAITTVFTFWAAMVKSINNLGDEEEQPNVRISTANRYELMINTYTIPRIGNVKLSKLTSRQLQKLYKDLLDHGRVHRGRNESPGLSSTTVHSVHLMLHCAFERAVKERLIPRNPTDDCIAPKVRKVEMKILPPEHMKAYLDAAQARGLLPMFYLELVSGLRKGELVALLWSDLDTKNRTISVSKQYVRNPDGTRTLSQPKTDTSIRMVSIPQTAVDLLIQEHEKHPDNPYMFPSPVTGEMYHPDSVVKLHEKILKDAGLEHINFHGLRHTFATMALQNGVDIKTVSNMLGHYDAGFTLRTYTHATRQKQDEAAQTMGNFMERVR